MEILERHMRRKRNRRIGERNRKMIERRKPRN